MSRDPLWRVSKADLITLVRKLEGDVEFQEDQVTHLEAEMHYLEEQLKASRATHRDHVEALETQHQRTLERIPVVLPLRPMGRKGN